MSNKKYQLDEFENPINWNYEPLKKEECYKLKKGDIVRLLMRGEEGWEKVYFEIKNIDYYKKGGIDKPRKFKGKPLFIYTDSFLYLKENEEISFQRKNILEIPGWGIDYVSNQKNKKLIEKYEIWREKNEEKLSKNPEDYKMDWNNLNE
jgi:hypothetical protein